MTNSKRLKRSLAMLATILMMTSSLAACGGKEDTTVSDAASETVSATTSETASETASDTATEVASEAASETASETVSATESAATSETSSVAVSSAASETSSANTEDTSTITEDEAIELVKQEMGEEYSFIPADELEEIDGSQYYVIYVKKLLSAGNYTTLATYLVKTDGSEVLDKYADSDSTTEDVDVSSYIGTYVKSGVTGETTFTVFEDGTFEMASTGDDVNQVVSGAYTFGVTNDANVISMTVYPKTIVKDSDGETIEEEVTDSIGTAVIEGDTLTLSLESEPTVFTKK